MRKLRILIPAVLLLCLLFTGCYASSYSATGFVHSNTSDEAFMNFYKFNGRMVFTLKCKNTEKIHYTGKLETGSIKVYYDDDGTKKDLISLKAGESFDETRGSFAGEKIYIIVETEDKCENGDLSFDVIE